jgi:uncharacterized membrane protein YdbT with pleckstrin-like domain
MSYVQRVLQPGETIRHTASIHWIVYVPGASLIVAALAVFAFAEIAAQGKILAQIVAGLLGIIGLFLFIREWFTWWTTEIAVTDRRIIYKEGFIRRNTVEMHMDKVESVDVEQSILARILDYGDVIVKGTGTGFEPLKRISAPLDLRNHVTGV